MNESENPISPHHDPHYQIDEPTLVYLHDLHISRVNQTVEEHEAERERIGNFQTPYSGIVDVPRSEIRNG